MGAKKVTCGSCRHFHRRPCQQSGVIQPHSIGYCCHGMEIPGRKRHFRQPAAWDGEQGQWPMREHLCKNWTGRP